MKKEIVARLVCPGCGGSKFLIEKGVYYCCDPWWREENGCGWHGTRAELRRIIPKKVKFNNEFACESGDAWRGFWLWWFPDARHDNSSPNDFAKGVALAIAEGLIWKR